MCFLHNSKVAVNLVRKLVERCEKREHLKKLKKNQRLEKDESRTNILASRS